MRSRLNAACGIASFSGEALQRRMSLFLAWRRRIIPLSKELLISGPVRNCTALRKFLECDESCSHPRSYQLGSSNWAIIPEVVLVVSSKRIIQKGQKRLQRDRNRFSQYVCSANVGTKLIVLLLRFECREVQPYCFPFFAHSFKALVVAKFWSDAIGNLPLRSLKSRTPSLAIL